MCTVFYLADLALLSKNRDKEIPEAEEIVRNDDILAVRSVGADYYSLGLNRRGCAFVSTAVNNPAWTAAVEAGRKDEARTLWARDTAGRTSPTRLVSESLPRVESAEEWIQLLQTTDALWRGYNVVLADTTGAWVVETYGREVRPRRLEPRDAITNHFHELPFGPRETADYPGSYARLDYAREKLATIAGPADLLAAIRPDHPADRDRIWRAGAFSTQSSTVLDLAGRRLLYTTSPERAHNGVSLAD